MNPPSKFVSLFDRMGDDCALSHKQPTHLPKRRESPDEYSLPYVPSSDLPKGQELPTEHNTQIPIGEKELLDTVSQIFSRTLGAYRAILLDYISTNGDDSSTQLDYIQKQCAIVLEQDKTKTKKQFHRELTHQHKKIQIGVQYYWENDAFKWCVVGADLQTVFRFLPKAKYADGTFRPPRTGTNHSKWYECNTHNDKLLTQITHELRMLQLYILKSGEQISARVKQPSTTSSTGILGLDLDVDTTTIKTYDDANETIICELLALYDGNHGNPTKIDDGVYIYNKNGTSMEVMKRLPMYLTEIIKMRGLFPSYLTCQTVGPDLTTIGHDINTLFMSDSYMAMIGIAQHSMFMIRHKNVWHLCDPWQKQLSRHFVVSCVAISMSAIRGAINYERPSDPQIEWKFLPRLYSEQYKKEGSCGVATLSRIIQLGITGYTPDVSDDEFVQFMNEPIKDWAALMAMCVVRHLRVT